jgi:hypothetical protein
MLLGPYTKTYRYPYGNLEQEVEVLGIAPRRDLIAYAVATARLRDR